MVDFDVLASLDDVVVPDDVTLRGYRKPAAGSRSNNLVVVYSFSWCGGWRLSGNIWWRDLLSVLELVVLPDAFLYPAIGKGIGALSLATLLDPKMTPVFYSVRPGRSELRVLPRRLWSSDVTHPWCFRAPSGTGWHPLEETRQWHGDQGREPDQEERVHISDHRCLALYFVR